MTEDKKGHLSDRAPKVHQLTTGETIHLDPREIVAVRAIPMWRDLQKRPLGPFVDIDTVAGVMRFQAKSNKAARAECAAITATYWP